MQPLARSNKIRMLIPTVFGDMPFCTPLCDLHFLLQIWSAYLSTRTNTAAGNVMHTIYVMINLDDLYHMCGP